MFGGGGNQNKNVFGESNFGQAKNPGGLFGAGSKTDSKSDLKLKYGITVPRD